jgi:hypothetical protein
LLVLVEEDEEKAFVMWSFLEEEVFEIYAVDMFTCTWFRGSALHVRRSCVDLDGGKQAYFEGNRFRRVVRYL